MADGWRRPSTCWKTSTRRHRPAADALKDWGLSHRFAGAGDRAAIGNIVYDALRRKRSAGWIVGDDTPRAIGFGALLLEWSETPQSLNAGTRRTTSSRPAPLSSDEELAGHRKPARLPTRRTKCAPTARTGARRFCEDTFGDDWIEEGIGLAARPPLDLRVNTLQARTASGS